MIKTSDTTRVALLDDSFDFENATEDELREWLQEKKDTGAAVIEIPIQVFEYLESNAFWYLTKTHDKFHPDRNFTMLTETVYVVKGMPNPEIERRAKQEEKALAWAEYRGTTGADSTTLGDK